MPHKTKPPPAAKNSNGSERAPVVAVRHANDLRDDMLSCKVCLGHYNTADQKPRALHCQHTFCERCIQDSLLKRHQVVCPLCKMKTRFTDPSDGVHRLSINATAAELGKQATRSDKAGAEVQRTTPEETEHRVVAKQATRLHPSPNEPPSPVSQQPAASEDSSAQIEAPDDHQHQVTVTETTEENEETYESSLDERLRQGAANARLNGNVTAYSHCDAQHVNDGATQNPNAVYVGRFGKYHSAEGGSSASRPGTFVCPSSIACSPPTQQIRGSRLVVVDVATSAVQLYAINGDFLSAFNATGARTACFIDAVDGHDAPERCRVAVATDHNVSVYDQLGRLQKTIPLDGVIALSSYRGGFVAAQRTRLSICERFLPTVSMSTIGSIIIRNTQRPVTNSKSIAVRGGQFRGIIDVAVGSYRNPRTGVNGTTLFYVLDIDVVYLIDPSTSVLQGAVRLFNASAAAARFASHPVSIAVDAVSGNVIVSDSIARRVDMYAISNDNDGGVGQARCLVQLGFDGGSAASPGVGACGPITVGTSGLLYVAVCGSGLAEIRMYRI